MTRPSVRRTLALALLLWAGAALADVPRIGAEDDWYPYTAWRDGRIQGMSAEIVRAAFASTGTAVELQSYPYSRCMELTRSGTLAGCFNTAPDSRIEAQFLLPEQALFSDDILLWAQAGAPPVQSLEDLVGKRIAVTIGYTYGERFDNYPGIYRIPVRRDLNSFLMLQRERVDYVIAYRATAQALLQENPHLAGRFDAVAVVHRPAMHLSFSRQHPAARALRQRFDEGMRQIRDDGTYQRILEHWQVLEQQTLARETTLQERHNDKMESR